MNKIQNLLTKYSTGKIVFFLFLVTQAIYFFMLFVTIPHVIEYSGGMNIFDLQPTGYSSEYARNLLDTLGTEGRSAYLFRQLPIDMVYPLFFAVTYSLFLTLLFRKGFDPNSKIRSLSLVPMISGLFDYLENIGIITMLSIYPRHFGGLAQLTSFFSISKSFFTVLFFILLFMGLIVLIKKKLGKRGKKRGGQKSIF